MEGAGGTAIVDAGYEPLTKAGNGLWRAEPTFGTGAYSAAVPFLDAKTGSETTTYAALADGSLLWTYSTQNYFKQYFSGQGIYPDRENNRVYVRLTGDKNPNTVPIYIARSQTLYILGSNNLLIRNPSFRHGTFGVVFIRGLLGGLQNILFEKISVSGSTAGLKVWGPNVDRLTVKNSSFSAGWNFNWWWSDVKEKHPKTMEGGAINLSAVTNSEFAYNTINGFFDGIGVQGNNVDVHHNSIKNGIDDGIEPEAETSEGDEVTNVRVHDNTISNMLNGIAMVPVQPGPLYVYRNTVIANGKINFDNSVSPPKILTSGAFKIGAYYGRADSLNTKVYQNTAYCLQACSGDNTLANTSPVMRDWEWYNNIFYTKGTKIFDLDAVNFPGNVFNRNLWYPIVFSRDTAPVTGDPLFVNISSLPFDLTVRSGSPAITPEAVCPRAAAGRILS